MSFAGGKRDGAGRPKGARNNRAVAEIERVAEKYPDWSPLMHMAAVANDPDLPEEIRLDAAKSAAPYVHSKAKPVEIDPEAYLDLQRALLAARIESAAETMASPGLAERLERAKLRHIASITVSTGIDRAPDDDLSISASFGVTDAQPAQPVPEPIEQERAGQNDLRPGFR